MADLDGRLSPACLEDLEDESLDPRIQVELERLNKASEEINRLELELDDGRASFRQALSDSTQKLNTLAKKLGQCVDKARPYYDARLKAKESHIESQKAALRFERACSMHEAAKEMVQLAEQGYMCREEPSDPAWQEMLNHATMKVNEAEKERNESEQEHRKTMLKFQDSEEQVHNLQKELKRTIAKSKPYFEMKARFNQTMEDQKRRISILEEDVHSAKAMYSEALRNLEKISDEIHQQRMEKRRNQELGVRGAGVGSETPSPPPGRDSSTSHTEERNSVHGRVYPPNSNAFLSTSSIQDNNQSEFVPPSVIHSSVEKARNKSYREAIESKEEFPVPSLESEFHSLPESRKKKVFDESNTLPHQHSSEIPEANQRSPSTVGVEGKQIYSPREQRSSSMQEALLGTAQSRTNQLSDESQLRSRKKLQAGGLILRIDNAMDPLAGVYSTQQIKPTRSLQHDHTRRPLSEPIQLTGQQMDSKGNVRTKEKRKLSSTASTPVQNSPTVLNVPGTSKEEDFSDTESVASTGPMLDDDQIELLTLEFPDQVSTEENTPEFKRQSWNRMSLPPKLSHLQPYIRQTSLEKDQETKVMSNTEKTTDNVVH